MDDVILLSQLNDFIFCPVSIYFHNLYQDMDVNLYQGKAQLEGTGAHKSVDEHTYSTSKSIIQSMYVYSDRYRLEGKIDLFDSKTGCLTERKKKIKNVYDGYVFQLYGQYFGLMELGYTVNRIRLHSIDDNKNYEIELPENNAEMFLKFEKLIMEMRAFQIDSFTQTNSEKCKNCIYESACAKSLI